MLQTAVTVLLSLVLIFFLARLGLVIVSPDAAVEADSREITTVERNGGVDIAGLQKKQLFGTRANDIVANGQADAPAPVSVGQQVDETRLNLRLEGVVVGKPTAAGFAMIAINGHTETYRIGDRLPVGNRVVLNNIFADRVIVENNGRMETLWLYDDTPTRRSVQADSNTSVARDTDLDQVITGSYDPMALVNQYREKFTAQSLSADFLTLSEIVKISPEYNNTQLLGYRLSPGEHLKEFVRLGLKTNDIVTRVNGIELNNIANLPNLFDVMSTASQVTLTLVRDGQPMDLSLALDALPRKD